jgi:hypothetical protein
MWCGLVLQGLVSLPEVHLFVCDGGRTVGEYDVVSCYAVPDVVLCYVVWYGRLWGGVT